VRGRGSTRGKKAIAKPTFTGRRSKEERTALEKDASAREAARNKEREKVERWKREDKEKKAARDAKQASRGRGGYSGAMSGPFSLGSSREGKLIVVLLTARC
jgi:DNA-directed RNA polymerase III subunit RPC4